MMFNEPNYAYEAGGCTYVDGCAGNCPSNVLSPTYAASLMPDIIKTFQIGFGMKLVSPSPVDCSTSDPSCKGVNTITGWLQQFFAALPAPFSKSNFEAINVHIYEPNINAVTSQLNSLRGTFGLPIWVTEIAKGALNGTVPTAQEQVTYMQAFDNYAKANRGTVPRYFWNGPTFIAGELNVLNSGILQSTRNSGCGTASGITGNGQVSSPTTNPAGPGTTWLPIAQADRCS
jgi:hypothetical protein